MIGSFFAILVVKQLFGGIGDNFLNPALTARAVLLASWPAHMTAFPAAGFNADAVSSATPLAAGAALKDLILGNVGGTIGETCKIAILLGFIYLLVTKTISWRITCSTLASFFIMSWIFKGSAANAFTAMMSGGILFGAVFMATDYATSPMLDSSQLVYGAGIGILTVIIRQFGSYPEGVTYAILLMNIVAPLLDRYMPQKIYGVSNKKKEASAK